MPVTLEILRGSAIVSCIEELSFLRIRVFREYPYLYDGDPDYEAAYLLNYSQAQDSLVVVARDQGRAVGASTGLPLKEADPKFQKPFIDDGRPVDSVFYFGESVLLPEYRGQGTGHRFFDEREKAALAWGASTTCFCAVDRPDEHSLRPKNYRSPESLWQKRGYQKQTKLQCTFPWKVINEEEKTLHTLTFWTKEWQG
jgi:GNAT superfamily N-acetyltransferase